jgi:hypothetical protein
VNTYYDRDMGQEMRIKNKDYEVRVGVGLRGKG